MMDNVVMPSSRSRRSFSEAIRFPYAAIRSAKLSIAFCCSATVNAIFSMEHVKLRLKDFPCG
jgi:hypothetical protein